MHIFKHHDEYGTLVFRLKKLINLKQVRDACRHNQRQISRELVSEGHIDSSRSSRNYSLLVDATPQRAIGRVVELKETYESQSRRRLQSNAVYAIEVVFSLPSEWHEQDSSRFFHDCFEWACREFDLAEAIQADIHLDESAPHMHIIFCCIRPNELTASKMCGSRKTYRMRSERFYAEVATKYGLQLPPPKLRKSEKNVLYKQVIARLEETGDPAARSAVFTAIRASVERNPVPYAQSLGIELRPSTSI